MDETPAEPLPAYMIGGDGLPLTRLQIEEACKLAYCSGKARLVELAVKWRIPYDTLRGWSSAGKWAVTLQEVASVANTGLVPTLADWLEKERREQIRTGLARARRGQALADEIVTGGGVKNVRDLRDLASAEKEFDLQARRNLGMEGDTRPSGPVVNVNALGTVTIQESSSAAAGTLLT